MIELNQEAKPQSGSKVSTASWLLPAIGIALIGGFFLISSLMEKWAVGESVNGAKMLLSPVIDSDDYVKNARIFGQAAGMLVESKGCTEEEIKSHGGFIRSVNHKPEPVYFTHCGGKRWYVNVSLATLYQ